MYHKEVKLYLVRGTTDIYPLSIYQHSRRSIKRLETFCGEKRESYGHDTIMDSLEMSGCPIHLVTMDDHIVGNIVRCSAGAWINDTIKKAFTIKNNYSGMTANLLCNPKIYRLHLEHEKYMKKKYMSIPLDTYEVKIFDRVVVNFLWERGDVSVHYYHAVSKNTIGSRNMGTVEKIYEKRWDGEKIEAIHDFEGQYECWRERCLPDIIEYCL